MTIICVRDGVMAVDSQVSQGRLRVAEMRKWAAVAPHWGGGFVAGTGAAGRIQDALRSFAERGVVEPAHDDDQLVHLQADGLMRSFEHGHWMTLTAPYLASGSGWQIATGAMAAGASALEAAGLVCSLMPTDCGGQVHELRIGPQAHAGLATSETVEPGGT